jgi:glycosyltransferase involved in cell wall biosynthesis
MDLYGISADKIKYLYLGTNVPEEMLAEREYIRREVRANYGIPESSFVIITGGKLNFDKRLDILVDALKNLNNENIYLLVFGTSDPEERDYAEKIIGKVSRIVMLGWCDAAAITRYYLAADIAIFPGGQSVLWQQAIGTGLPAIFRRWPGNEYLNIGNALFLYSESSEELAQSIELLLEPRNTWMLCDMRDKALELARTKISYRHEAVEIIKSAMRKK